MFKETGKRDRYIVCVKEEGLEKSRMGKRRDLKLRRKKRKMSRRFKRGIKKKEENLHKFLICFDF